MPTVRVPLSGHGHVRLRIEEEGGASIFLVVVVAVVIAFTRGGTDTNHPTTGSAPPGAIPAGAETQPGAPPGVHTETQQSSCRIADSGLTTSITGGALQARITNQADHVQNFRVLVTFYDADSHRRLDDAVIVFRAVAPQRQSAVKQLAAPQTEAGLRCRFAISHF
jgi:hypothetical protein